LLEHGYQAGRRKRRPCKSVIFIGNGYNLDKAHQSRGAHASRVQVLASRQNLLPGVHQHPRQHPAGTLTRRHPRPACTPPTHENARPALGNAASFGFPAVRWVRCKVESPQKKDARARSGGVPPPDASHASTLRTRAFAQRSASHSSSHRAAHHMRRPSHTDFLATHRTRARLSPRPAAGRRRSLRERLGSSLLTHGFALKRHRPPAGAFLHSSLVSMSLVFPFFCFCPDSLFAP
jgi:hypothetical protein